MRITKESYESIISAGIKAEALLANEKKFQNSKNKFLSFTCECSKQIAFNGITSHSKICNLVKPMVSKQMFNDIVTNYKGREYCVICGEPIPDIKSCKRYKSRRIHVCSVNCRKELFRRKTLKQNVGTSKCQVCNCRFYWKGRAYKTCSTKCNNKYISLKVTEDWEKLKKNTTAYDKKCKNQGLGFKANYSYMPPWNKGMSGEEYMSHYIQEDGSNSFYDALQKNNGWFKPSNVEFIFKTILDNGNYRYQHSFFSQNSQFDFLLSFNNNVYVIEIDGDYWHKSSRREPDIEKRKIIRLADKLKSNKIKNIKNTNKIWHVLRFWEIDLYNEPIKIINHISNLKEFDNDQRKIESEISKISTYYEKSA
jgi:very-short-patch-repair endonuclease